MKGEMKDPRKTFGKAVSEIAEKCGYGNVSSFSPLFKRKKGIPPIWSS